MDAQSEYQQQLQEMELSQEYEEVSTVLEDGHDPREFLDQVSSEPLAISKRTDVKLLKQ